jgi:hypothetical protein
MSATKDVVTKIIQTLAKTTKIEGEKLLLVFHVPTVAVGSHGEDSDLARRKLIYNSHRIAFPVI